jgi:glycosyltransferase involved in cell wall biosynthesis
VTQSRSLDHRLIQIFNRYLEPGGEEVWVKTLESSFSLPTCYLESSDWTGAKAPPIWRQAMLMIHNPQALRKLRELQARERAEAWIIQNAFPTASIAIYAEAQRQRIPVIQYVHNFRPFAMSYLQVHDLESFSNRTLTYLKEIARGSWQDSRVKTAWFAIVLSIAHLLRRFDAVTAWIAVSNFMRDQFIRAGVPAEKIFTLRHFWRPTADVNTTSDEDYYLFVGRLVELKGVLVLLDVWDKIFQEKGAGGPQLVIVGDGSLQRIVRQRAEHNPLVDYRGSIPSETKRQLLKGMRALIAPSLCLESLGLVAYEAYEFGKPVLAARAGALGEIVLHEQTGLIHEPGDSSALYEQIMKLEDNSQFRAELGRKGRKWLLDNANEEKWREEFNRIIDFAIARMHNS